MASKNKIIVHIGDDLLYDSIINEAKLSGKKQSEFVRGILEKELSMKIIERKERINRDYSILDRNNYATSYPLNITVDSERQVTSSGVHFFPKIDEVITHEYQSHFFGMMALSLKQIMNGVKNEVQSLIPRVVERRWYEIELGMEYADINLVFINRVDVIFKDYTTEDYNQNEKKKEPKATITLKIHLQVSRFVINAMERNNDFLRIDFLNVNYKRFKDIAINGWLSKRYERFLYFKPVKEVLLGGYFAGLLYRPKKYDELLNEIQELFLDQDYSRNGMLVVKDKFVKLHMNGDQIKLNIGSFRHGFEKIKEIRSGFIRDGKAPEWMGNTHKK